MLTRENREKRNNTHTHTHTNKDKKGGSTQEEQRRQTKSCVITRSRFVRFVFVFLLKCVFEIEKRTRTLNDSLNKFVTNFLRKRSKDFREREHERE